MGFYQHLTFSHLAPLHELALLEQKSNREKEREKTAEIHI